MNGLAICVGIGGIDLGLKEVVPGYRTICYVEREVYAAAVLVHQMEAGRLDSAPVWDDLATFDGIRWAGLVDLIHAGLPCQPFSVAGKRGGDQDERYIWPDFFRIVEEVSPALVFLENVPGILAWFRPIGEELCRLGYEFEAGIFSAEEVGAPHRRERFFCLAYASGQRRQQVTRGTHGDETEHARRTKENHYQPSGFKQAVVDTPRSQCTRRTRGGVNETRQPPQGFSERSPFPPGPSDPAWGEIIREWPELAPAVAGRLNPIFVEYLQGFPLHWTQLPGKHQDSLQFVPPDVALALREGTPEAIKEIISPNRIDRLRALGNAVVPATAAKAFQVLSERLP